MVRRAPIIVVERTPNPLTRKFDLGETVTEQPFDLVKTDPLPDTLRAFFTPGVEGVFVGAHYLAVTVGQHGDWEEVDPSARRATAALMADLGPLLTLGLSRATAMPPPESDPVVGRILELLETRVKPAVAHDGGDINFHSFEKGVLKLRMSGACSGCPSSTATLKLGIRNMMQYFLPEVLDVEAV